MNRLSSLDKDFKKYSLQSQHAIYIEFLCNKY